LVVGEQGVMDGRQESRNGNRIVLDRKVSGRQQGVASWMGQGTSKIEKVSGKQQGVAEKVVVDENASGRMGRTSRDICVGAFVSDWSCRDVKAVGSPDELGWPATESSRLAFARLGGAESQATPGPGINPCQNQQ
jgi:hypothetical protein